MKSCPRNSKNIRDKTIPHSFSVGRPSDCPKMIEIAYSDVDKKFVAIETLKHEPNESPMREKMIESLEAMETCTRICEIESKAWHDAWVVRRALVRAMWLVLTWIIKQIDKKG